MKTTAIPETTLPDATPGRGLALWLLEKLKGRPSRRPRLELVERITLAPRQSLALVEAEGRRLLVATSPEGAPTFYPLDGGALPSALHAASARALRASAARAGRVSW